MDKQIFITAVELTGRIMGGRSVRVSGAADDNKLKELLGFILDLVEKEADKRIDKVLPYMMDENFIKPS